MQRIRRVFWSVYGRFVWDANRARERDAQIRQVVASLRERQVAPGERVLDAGCGTGNYVLALARAGFQVVGVDYAAGMLARARDKVTDDLLGTLLFQQADLSARLAFPDASFHHAINISALQAVPDPAFTLSELQRVLKPGGTLVLLHVPRPKAHDLPLRQDVRGRIRRSGARAPWKMALVAAKAWAERTGHSQYWTAAELQQMLQASQFDVLCTDYGPPIVIVAEKSP